MLPDGFVASEIQWPYPELISTPLLATYGYEGEVVLLTQITPPPTLTESTYRLRALVDWLMCKEECIPGRADLEVVVNTGDDDTPRSDLAALFEAARRRLPRESEHWLIRARRDGADLLLVFRGPYHLDSVQFFPYDENLIEHAATQRLQRVGDDWFLRIKRSTHSEDWPNRLLGVAVATPSWSDDPSHRAIPIDLTLPKDAARITATAPISPNTPPTFAAALVMAFVGGIILNFMPCVFPVISIKVLGFVEQARASRRRLVIHGVLFATGVIVCFWLLAGALIALRSWGAEIGWGFQLQSPRFVMALAALFFTLGLSLLGAIEFGLFLTRAGEQLEARNGYTGSFLGGLLATIVATPCTAPFMGAALGYALTLPTSSALAIFTALGAGMAIPYVLLSLSPRLIKLIPRPGPWMETLKQAMGFLLLTTVVWLIWVLSHQVRAEVLVNLAALFLALGIAIWIAGRWGALHRPLKTRVCARIIAWGIAISALLGVLSPDPAARARDTKASETTEGQMWERFTPERVAELRAAGKPIFIDFTAAWCLTCQVNKRVALSNAEVKARLHDLGVATLRADWTDRDEMITRALAEFGRSGVPLYVLYPADPSASPILLPELLTPGIVLDALAGIHNFSK
jgi:thiol:disulfide interchange protein DsbD